MAFWRRSIFLLISKHQGNPPPPLHNVLWEKLARVLGPQDGMAKVVSAGPPIQQNSYGKLQQAKKKKNKFQTSGCREIWV